MINSIKTALGMFTKLPVKSVWEEEGGAKALCWFPLCGLFCGSFTAFIIFLTNYISSPLIVSAFLAELSLYFISGFLHLDGFMDVTDALLSSRGKDDKIRILKDSNVGSFSVVSVILIMLGNFVSIMVLIYETPYFFFILAPILSRALSSYILFTFPPLSENGILAYFRKNKKTSYPYIMFGLSVIVLISMFAINISYGIAGAALCASIFCVSLITKNKFGGINGDVIGACIIFGEFISYLVLSIII